MPKVPRVHKHCGIHPKQTRKEITHLCDREIEDGALSLRREWIKSEGRVPDRNVAWTYAGFLLTPNEPDENTPCTLLRPGEELEMLMGSTFNFYHLRIFPVIMAINLIWSFFSSCSSPLPPVLYLTGFQTPLLATSSMALPLHVSLMACRTFYFILLSLLAWRTCFKH